FISTLLFPSHPFRGLANKYHSPCHSLITKGITKWLMLLLLSYPLYNIFKERSSLIALIILSKNSCPPFLPSLLNITGCQKNRGFCFLNSSSLAIALSLYNIFLLS